MRWVKTMERSSKWYLIWENWHLLTSNHPYNLWVDRNSSGKKHSYWKRLCLCTGNWASQYCEEWMSPQLAPCLSLRVLKLGIDAQGSNFSLEKGYRCPPQIHLRFSSSSLFCIPLPAARPEHGQPAMLFSCLNW